MASSLAWGSDWAPEPRTRSLGPRKPSADLFLDHAALELGEDAHIGGVLVPWAILASGCSVSDF
jgi:hypothetical protein